MKDILVVLTKAEWCGHCKSAAPEFKKLLDASPITLANGTQATVKMLDADKGRDPHFMATALRQLCQDAFNFPVPLVRPEKLKGTPAERIRVIHRGVDPAEFDPARKCETDIGFEDPREEDGELLFPARFPIEVVERDEAVMGAYASAGQFQQRPAPRGGVSARADVRLL